MLIFSVMIKSCVIKYGIQLTEAADPRLVSCSSIAELMTLVDVIVGHTGRCSGRSKPPLTRLYVSWLVAISRSPYDGSAFCVMLVL